MMVSLLREQRGHEAQHPHLYPPVFLTVASQLPTPNKTVDSQFPLEPISCFPPTAFQASVPFHLDGYASLLTASSLWHLTSILYPAKGPTYLVIQNKHLGRSHGPKAKFKFLHTVQMVHDTSVYLPCLDAARDTDKHCELLAMGSQGEVATGWDAALGHTKLQEGVGGWGHKKILLSNALLCHFPFSILCAAFYYCKGNRWEPLHNTIEYF